VAAYVTNNIRLAHKYGGSNSDAEIGRSLATYPKTLESNLHF
jgi:hypothetical protein